ncbi:MAG: NAD(P)H-dependent oxidoreductase [Fulvivirga sp.]
MQLLENLKWRYATKMFDPNRKVVDQDLERLKEAVRLSVSSYGLQLYRVLVIENEELKEGLRKAAYDQSQLTDASHVFVFCNYTNNFNYRVDEYIALAAKNATDIEGLRNYGESIKTAISGMDHHQRQSWSEKQTYLALNNLLVACAELKIDACPMEGFSKQAFNEILGLGEVGLNASVIAPVGYRSKYDQTQHRPKVRRPAKQLFQTI